jgi:hypothetical protein
MVLGAIPGLLTILLHTIIIGFSNPFESGIIYAVAGFGEIMSFWSLISMPNLFTLWFHHPLKVC